MPSISSAVVFAALLASAPVWAQSSLLAERVITPSTFLGVELQGDFMTEVPECAPEDENPAEACRVATKKAGQFEVRGLPYLPISPGYKLFATVNDGSVIRLVLTGKASNLYLVKEMLTEKLGKPVSSRPQWVRLKSGASYEAETFKWNTQGVAVDFGRNDNDLGQYSVIFSSSGVGDMTAQGEVTPAVDGSSL